MSATATEPEVTTSAPEQLEKWRRLIVQRAGRYAKWYGLDREEIEQDVRLYVLRNFHRWDPNRGAFTTWLIPRIRNSVSKIITANRRHTVPAISLSTPVGDPRDHARELVDHQPDPRSVDVCDLVDDRMRRDEVWRAIALLPPDEQAVITKRFVRDDRMTPADRKALESALSRLADVLMPPLCEV